MDLLSEIKKCTAGILNSGLLSVEKRLIFLITFSNIISVVCGFIVYVIGDITYTLLIEAGLSDMQTKLLLVAILLFVVQIIIFVIRRNKEKCLLNIKKEMDKSRLNITIDNINLNEIVCEFIKGFKSEKEKQ